MDAKDAGFLGRGWAFPPRFDTNSGAVQMAHGDDDIAESLRILMSTRPGERIMNPGYGCRLNDFVFEIADASTRAAIETAIRQAILHYEPRITLLDVRADVQDWREGRMRVTLEYSVDQTNARSNVVFPFYIHEGTLVAEAAAQEV